MLNPQKTHQPDTYQIELISIEMLVPKDHLLRLIHTHVDFSFIREKVGALYSKKQGRPSLDPVALFKMMLIGYLYGIRSERRLEQEIIPNAAYRWFLGLSLAAPVPDHSTLSWNRNNRFKGTSVFQEIFDEVVRLATGHHMVGGRILITDSTHIQANASKNGYQMQVVTDTPHEYLEQLEVAINEDRAAHGKKPLPPVSKEKTEKKNKVSSTKIEEPITEDTTDKASPTELDISAVEKITEKVSPTELETPTTEGITEKVASIDLETPTALEIREKVSPIDPAFRIHIIPIVIQ